MYLSAVLLVAICFAIAGYILGFLIGNIIKVSTPKNWAKANKEINKRNK